MRNLMSMAAMGELEGVLQELAMLTLYRAALQIRKQTAAFGAGALTWLHPVPPEDPEDPEDDLVSAEGPAAPLLIFRRGTDIVCAVNTGTVSAALPVELSGATVRLASDPLASASWLPAVATVWLHLEPTP